MQGISASAAQNKFHYRVINEIAFKPTYSL